MADELVDTGTFAEVPPDQRLDVDEGPDRDAREGGLDDDLDDLYLDPGEPIEVDVGVPPDELERGGGLRWASPWEGARRCTDGSAAGARALLAWALAEYGARRAVSMGIYNCRTVRGGSTRSIHGEGRALDLGLPLASDGTGIPLGHDIVERLGRAGSALGIQCVIYDRRIWSAVSPSSRAYTGIHPHYDHLHIELTRRAGQRMTLATFRRHLGGGDGPGVQPTDAGATGSGTTPEDPEEEIMFCKEGDESRTVEYWQRLLLNMDHYTGELDGDYGPKTRAAVKKAVSRKRNSGKEIGPWEAAAIQTRLATSE